MSVELDQVNEILGKLSPKDREIIIAWIDDQIGVYQERFIKEYEGEVFRRTQSYVDKQAAKLEKQLDNPKLGVAKTTGHLAEEMDKLPINDWITVYKLLLKSTESLATEKDQVDQYHQMQNELSRYLWALITLRSGSEGYMPYYYSYAPPTTDGQEGKT